MYSTLFEGKDFWILFFQKILVYFMRASPLVPCRTNSKLIKVKPLWRLPLTYLPSLEVALSDSVTCTKRSAPNKNHIIVLCNKHNFHHMLQFIFQISSLLLVKSFLVIKQIKTICIICSILFSKP